MVMRAVNAMAKAYCSHDSQQVQSLVKKKNSATECRSARGVAVPHSASKEISCWSRMNARLQ